MNIGRAVGIVKQILSEHYTDNEKALAIYQVMNMPTLNSVTKDELVKVTYWLWHMAFDFEDEDGKGEGNALD